MMPSLFVQTKPRRRPLAQKSLLAPYSTWIRVGSMMSRRPRESVGTKGVGFGIARLEKTDCA